MINRPAQMNRALPPFITLSFYTAILLFATACSQKTGQKPKEGPGQKERIGPLTTLFSNLPADAAPKVTMLDTVPKPVVRYITRKDKSFHQANERMVEENLQEGSDESKGDLVADVKGRGFFASYSTDDGLTLDQVYCSYKDKWGNLWFGTNGGGVSKYDGKNFTTYTTANGLASNIIWCITQDREDNLWFGTDGSGASKYDGESFANYTTAQGLPDNVIFSITGDKAGNLWFGTLKGGVSKWDGKGFVTYSTKNGLAGNAVKATLQDSKGNFWFATPGGGVGKWDGRTFVNYTVKDGLAGNKVFSVAEDDSGNVWFGSDGKGLTKYDGHVFTACALFHNPSGDAVQCITKDKQGALWMGTQKSGLIKYDGNVFINYSTANGLPGNHITAITEDEGGNLWLGTFGGGVCKFAGNSFTSFTTLQGLTNNVIFSIEEDKEKNLWFGTSAGGVCRYDGKAFTAFTQADGLARNEIYCVLKDRAGNLWFGTSGGGVSKYDGRSFTNYTTLQGLANNIVFSMVEDKKGNLWFATSGGGLSKFDGKSFTNYTTAQGLAGNVVFSSKEDKNGALWFGTLGGGVSKFDGAGFTNYTVEQGLSDNVVWTIAADKGGDLWFGTQKGLSLMQPETVDQEPADNKGKALFTPFTTDDGLPDNFVTQVIEGDGETLYAGTNLGICELLPAKSGNSSGKGWSVGRTFNARHGYPVKDVNAGLKAMFKDSRGIIWIGTGSDKTGLVRFDPAALHKSSSSSPRVSINGIRINNETLSWRSLQKASDKTTRGGAGNPSVTEETTTYGRRLTDLERDSIRLKFGNVNFDGITKWQGLPQGLVLPYYFNNVSFGFGAVETGKNFLVNYKYLLEGYDKDWSPASRNTYVNFGNINEGSYVFKVKAQNPDGAWGEAAVYPFKVLPPWWRTWWMFAVYAALITALILLFFRWKNQRIIYKQKILERRIAVATKKVREESEKVQVQKKKAEDALKELKEAQAQLIQSEKMAGLGELTAGIAHEIQNPLNFVNNFSEVSSELIVEMKDELLKGNYGDADAIADDVRQNLEKINHHGKRAAAIVKGMLQHSRSSNGQKEETDINALCGEYLRLSYQGLRAKDKSFNATIKTDFDESAGTVNIVQQDIGRVILNLLTNAFYAVAEKKKTVDESYLPTVSVQTKKLSNKVEISVSDNGKGIPQKIVDKIFQPFFTTKPAGHGTGLGLSLSYDIVTKGHGGELKVETREGEGTAFIVSLYL